MNDENIQYGTGDVIAQPDPVEEQEVIEEEQPQDVHEDYEETQPEAEQKAESKSERNWREMRERTNRLERERDEAVNLLKQIEQEALKYQQQPAKQEKSVLDIDDDEIIEGRHLKSLIKNELESIKKNVSTYQRQQEETTVERHIRDKYSDWDEVVNNDTVRRLNEEYPDIAYSLSLNNDLKKKATSTYTIMKKLGIATGTTNEVEHKRAQTNMAKPRSSNSAGAQYGSSPLNKANAFAAGFTEEDRQRLYREMLESANSPR